MARPLLTDKIGLNDFYNYYWLKEELVQFCRQHQLPTNGNKKTLTERIAAYVSGKPIPITTNSRVKVKMPDEFTHQTIIGKNWRCSQDLRFYLEQEIGSHFHFDKVMRDLIHNGQGKTIGEVIRTWLDSQNKHKQETEIAPQFEYNRFIRDYFQLHTEANFKDAVKAWNIHKSRPK